MAKSQVQRGRGRDELIAATLRLISTRGMHALTMRDIAAESLLSLGSTTYHFADRAGLLAGALAVHVTHTESIVDDAVDTLPTRGRKGDKGVQTALAALFADRQAVVLRSELRLEASRDAAVGELHYRSVNAIRRLITAALHANGRSTTATTVRITIADLEIAASDAAVAHNAPEAFASNMSEHLRRYFDTDPVN